MIAFGDPGMFARRLSPSGKREKDSFLLWVEIPRLERARISRKSERTSAPTIAAISLHLSGPSSTSQRYLGWPPRRLPEKSSRSLPFETEAEGIGHR